MPGFFWRIGGKMVVGNCALCRSKDVQLMNSHLIASAFFKIFSINGNNPVFLDGVRGKALERVKHVKTHLLCDDCEKRLKTSEDVVSRSCWKSPTEFRLRDNLSAIPSHYAACWPQESLPPEIKASDYLHFAISVFWRASVTKWNDTRIDPYFGALDLEYMEAFRLFLYENNQQLPNVAIVVEFASDKDINPLYILPPQRNRIPIEERIGPAKWLHVFLVPGLTFKMVTPGDCSRERSSGVLIFKETTFRGSTTQKAIYQSAVGMDLVGKLKDGELASIWPKNVNGRR
jgi:hypothetical protein